MPKQSLTLNDFPRNPQFNTLEPIKRVELKITTAPPLSKFEASGFHSKPLEIQHFCN